MPAAWRRLLRNLKIRAIHMISAARKWCHSCCGTMTNGCPQKRRAEGLLRRPGADDIGSTLQKREARRTVVEGYDRVFPEVGGTQG